MLPVALRGDAAGLETEGPVGFRYFVWVCHYLPSVGACASQEAESDQDADAIRLGAPEIVPVVQGDVVPG